MRALTILREQADQDARLLYEERETDWEDQAANVAAASALDHRGDSERSELRLLHAAIERLDAGTWGVCQSCHQQIDGRRLRAVPEAARCMDCLAQRPAAPVAQVAAVARGRR